VTAYDENVLHEIFIACVIDLTPSKQCICYHFSMRLPAETPEPLLGGKYMKHHFRITTLLTALCALSIQLPAHATAHNPPLYFPGTARISTFSSQPSDTTSSALVDAPNTLNTEAAAKLQSSQPQGADTTTVSGTVATTDQTSNGRAMPSPIDSPPFPGGDWLGYPVIGEPDGVPVYPLQKALFGDSLNASRIKVYGWVDASVNFSSSKESNYPLSYAIVPNAIELDQLSLRIERQPDTVQTDHTDWGFRLSTLYGMDYRFTTSKGWFSDQLLKNNNLYGIDPLEAYGIWYFPHVGQGMYMRVGRFISPPDIEAQTAPDNYIFSHSIMFTVDPYTFTGINSMIRLSPQWELMMGLHAGADMAPWSDSSSLNGQLMARWVSKDNNDSIWGGINSIGAGKVLNEHDDLQQMVATWGHRFNDKLHMMTEMYYMWEYDGLSGGTPSDGQFQGFGQTGGGPGPLLPGLSSEIGAVNYFNIKMSDKDYLTIRNDYFNDPRGQRYGFPGAMLSHTIGYVRYLTPLLSIRPEVRYEYALNSTPWDNGTRGNQFTVSADVIQRF